LQLLLPPATCRLPPATCHLQPAPATWRLPSIAFFEAFEDQKGQKAAP